MKLYITFLLLLFIIDPISNSDCSNIKPTKASDCVLSKNDKKTYKYCCYEYDIFIGGYACAHYTQSTYEVVRDINDKDDVFICNHSTSLYFKFTLLLFFLTLF